QDAGGDTSYLVSAPGPATPRGCAESSQLPRAPSPSPSQCAVLAAGRGVLCWLRRVSSQLHPLFRGGVRGAAGYMDDTLLGPRFAPYMQLHMAKERVYLFFPSGGGCSSGLPLVRIPHDASRARSPSSPRGWADTRLSWQRSPTLRS